MKTPRFALCLTLALPLACGDDSDPAGTDSESGDTTAADATDSSSTNADTTDSTDTTDADSGTETTGDIEVDCANEPWDIDGEFEWKGAWMAQCMVPVMAPLLQEIDPVKYAEFDCSFCHGEDLGGGEFTMPATVELDWMTADTWPTEYYDASSFSGPMANIALTAGETLGYPPFDPGSGTGFGCGGCHVGL